MTIADKDRAALESSAKAAISAATARTHDARPVPFSALWVDVITSTIVQLAIDGLALAKRHADEKVATLATEVAELRAQVAALDQRRDTDARQLSRHAEHLGRLETKLQTLRRDAP